MAASGVATGLPAGSYANVAAGDQAARVQVQADGTATFEVLRRTAAWSRSCT